VVTGESAGGNLAVNLAYSAAQGTAVSACGGTVPVPRAVVAVVPVVDPRDAYDHGVPLPATPPPDHHIATGLYAGRPTCRRILATLCRAGAWCCSPRV